VKVVLDTNVLLAGVATQGICQGVVTECLQHHELITSVSILDEFSRHLLGKFKMPLGLARETIAFIRGQSLVVVPAKFPPEACRDPADLMVLGTAVVGAAQYIVTGDKDLLVLERYQNVAIVTPREFYQFTHKESEPKR
jgi:putative PIN family toxin of toxin-antitoxin system